MTPDEFDHFVNARLDELGRRRDAVAREQRKLPRLPQAVKPDEEIGALLREEEVKVHDLRDVQEE